MQYMIGKIYLLSRKNYHIEIVLLIHILSSHFTSEMTQLNRNS